jgi:hypothetical protein
MITTGQQERAGLPLSLLGLIMVTIAVFTHLPLGFG